MVVKFEAVDIYPNNVVTNTIRISKGSTIGSIFAPRVVSMYVHHFVSAGRDQPTHWASSRRLMLHVLVWDLTPHSGTIDFVLLYSLILFKIKPAH